MKYQIKDTKTNEIVVHKDLNGNAFTVFSNINRAKNTILAHEIYHKIKKPNWKVVKYKEEVK